MKSFILLTLLITFQSYSQSIESIYELDRMDSLLSQEVKRKLDERIIDKRVIFLGEAEHHIGSDFLSKTQFVKYLVLNHGFKDIAFEGDFFALYNNHDPKNLFPHWSKSAQCQDLFEFLKKHEVTIWGFDSQFSSVYSFRNFSVMLFNFLNENKIAYEPIFKTQVEKAMQRGPEINRVLKDKEIVQLFTTIDTLLKNSDVQKSHFWAQALQSFKSSVQQNVSKRKLGIEVRDKQMASNLNFLTSEQKDRKFLVWAANAHISKLDLPAMNEQTMGFQYLRLNPDITYHIAFSSIRMPYRKEKWITEQRKDPNNLLSLLPSLSKNYYLDCNAIKLKNINPKDKEFAGMFGMGAGKTKYFEHFDALIFIANGEKSRLIE